MARDAKQKKAAKGGDKGPDGKFKKGNKGGTGGARAGAGRPPNWLRDLCREELLKNRAKGVRLIGDIHRGEAKFQRVFCSKDGDIVRAEIGPSETGIVAAAQFLADRAAGKPKQALDVTGSLTLEDLVAGSREDGDGEGTE